MEIIALFFLFQVKHYYADFVIQTYAQTVRKGIYRDPVGISHSVDHAWTTLVALLVFDIFFQPLTLMLMIGMTVAEAVVHYHIDWLKVKYGTKDNTKPLFWNQFGMDQLAHQICYLVMVWYILVF
jgi:Protein of unknown function (DUF3307)